MTEISSLESDILGAITSASDEGALESVRIAALGKKGTISELLFHPSWFAPGCCGQKRTIGDRTSPAWKIHSSAPRSVSLRLAYTF